MPFETGGLADKLGNRYESRWLATQLLSLLNEKILSVTVEAIGNDEKGVDLWIEQQNGVRQAHQCKARNGSNEFWHLGALASRGVLGNLKYQLDRDPTHVFFFVSSVGSEVFQSICDFARRSNNNPDCFYQEKILKRGEKVQECFEKFCGHLSLNPAEKSDQTQAFQYLQRTYINVYPDDHGAWQSLLEQTDFLLSGAPQTSIATLIAYAENNDRFGSPIHADELRRFLAENGIHPKRLGYDSRIAPAIEVLQREFAESIRPQLIGGAPLHRSATALLIEAINNGQNVVLSGAAGCGKSGVLYELTEYLEHDKIPYLPIRLDRREPTNTAEQFGKQMGLPDCPALALAALAGGRQSVLILDQLDAIRWTSAHSDNALDVCKALEGHAQQLRLSGGKISIVLCCRTFDLEHDPSIRNWLSNQNAKEFIRVEVKNLSSEKIEKLVGALFSQMTEKEKSLLASPLNLSIWLELNRSGIVPQFRTATDLMRAFWNNRRLVLHEKANIPPDQLDQVLTPLIDFMEKNGKISAPERIVAKWPRLREALLSYGILQQSANMISFCHQRYLDFLIADRLLLQIDSDEGSILEWLGAKEKQSLLRREQLRQALVMLAEELPTKFLTVADQIFSSEKIRFHIKHLVLELIGSLEELTSEFGDCCLRLLADDCWQLHVLETVFAWHPHHVVFLCDKGVIGQWLDSPDEDIVNRALGLLRSVADKIPDVVAQVMAPNLNRGGEWPGRILNSMPWKIDDDSERLFKLRLELARRGVVATYIDWRALCKKHSFRAIQLIEAILSKWEIDDEPEELSQNRFERWSDQDKKVLEQVARKFPHETWDCFLPHIERLTRFETDSYDARHKKWRKNQFGEDRIVALGRGVVELSILVGQELAANHPDYLVERASFLEASTAPVIQEILVETYKCLPPNHADHGIQWLLSNPARFRLGSGFDETEWKPAERLIAALSPHCSEVLFRRLEDAIFHYHAPEEKREAKYHLKGWKDGHFGHYWGKTQYFLIPALAAERVTSATNSLMQVLLRKFAKYPEDRFLRSGHCKGGWVGSKLDQNLEKISDQAWLKIICNPKVKAPNRQEWIQVSPDHVLETSVRQFSSSLNTIAKRYPERFAQLALRFPVEVDSAFLAAILDGSGKMNPDANLPEEAKESWQPARIDTIEAVLDKFQATDDRETAMSFCRLISERHEERWSDAILARLVNYAQNHPDPKPEEFNIDCTKSVQEASVITLFQNAINCVRGTTAGVIEKLLFHKPELLGKLRPGIESLINDHHPAVRMAAAEMLLPVLNIDKPQAVAWYAIACKNDLRIAASPRGIKFYDYTIPSHFDRIAPIIRQMMLSPWDDVAKEGSRQITARWLFHGYFEDELKICQAGTIPQRQGIADVAVQLLHEQSLSESCMKILKPLLNDPDKEVRGNLTRLFHGHQDTLNNDALGPFILEYIYSQTFTDDPSAFIWIIKEYYTGSILFLADAIFSMCKVFSTTLKANSQNTGTSIPYAITETVSLLLRLYEHAVTGEKSELATRCLAIWDIFFQNRVGVVRDLTQAIAADS